MNEMPADVVAREIANGAWFLVNLSCLLLCIRYTFIKGFWKDGFSTSKLLRSRDYAVDVQVSVALSVYFVGATLRAGYVWMMLKAQDAGWDALSDWLATNYSIMFLAAGFAVVGGLCSVRVFSDWDWGPKAWIAAAVLAFTIPTIVHYLF